jgi:RecA/RadA recombinase
VKDTLEHVEKLLTRQIGQGGALFSQFAIPLLLGTPAELARVFEITTDEATTLLQALASSFKHPFTRQFGPIQGTKTPLDPSKALHTDFKRLDELMGGGFRPGNIYQLFGADGTGKTEFCYRLIHQYLAGDSSGQADAFVIDADLTFRPERLRQISGGSIDLARVHVATCHSYPHFEVLLKTVDQMIDEGKDVRFLVVDSILPVSFQLYDDDLVKRQVMLRGTIDHLARIARDRECCVVFTNHAIASGEYPSGGTLLMDAADYVIQFSKDIIHGSPFFFRVMKSDGTPEGTWSFTISADGIHEAQP